jgi:hypothetical protein
MSVGNQGKPSTPWANYPDPEASSDGSVPDEERHPAHQSSHSKHGGHGWMMLLMCLPLVGIGLWQFASGAGLGPLLGGLACFGMMAVMHLGMGSSRRH